MKKINFILVLFLLLVSSLEIKAQDLLQSKDLTTVQVDYLSDSDIVKIDDQLKKNNVTIEQAKPQLLTKGMTESEYLKLSDRLSKLTPKKVDKKPSNDTFGRGQEVIANKKVKDTLNNLVFGSELFDTPMLDFNPDLKLATPLNYILGPGDELQVSVYGVQQYDATLPVSVEGKVSIDYVGEISVSGMTIEAATQKIKSSVSRVYSTVASGQSKVSVSLTRIRTIKVTVIGSKQPGNYSISSLATVYNALHLAGGPGKNGSYRNIELIRDNKVFKTIDIYRFLLKGDQSDNVGLKDNDVIRIPAYSKRVTVEGEVKRPGIFEMKKGESFSDLLAFTSGFNEFAYTASVHVLQKTGKEQKVHDVNAADFAVYQPQSGDLFKVTKILNRFENRIQIEGAVFRPAYYSFYEGMRISDLIAQAEGLKEDAFTKRARIVRLKSDLTTEIINTDLGKALTGDANYDILLQREDVVTIYSVLEFREEYKVTIDGEVKNPGVYDYYDNLTLRDLVDQVGGLTGSASKRVEIARMVKGDVIDDANPNKIELINLEMTADNETEIKNYTLMPFDVVNIRKLAVYEKPQMVTISGAIMYPGKYVLATKKESVYDIVNRAGGLTSVANIDGVKIKRPIQQDQIDDLKNVNVNIEGDSLQNKNLADKLKNELKFATIPVDWEKIVQDPQHFSNVTMFPGDQIEVSMFNQGVKVSGNVLLTSEIPYKKGKSFNYYLSSVGGVDNKGWKKRAYIIYPNGKAATASSFLFFRSYPKVLPDSQIVVPEKPESTKMSTGEWVSIGSVITSLALLIVTAFK